MVLGVIGVGLIGGSLAISLLENGFATRVLGYDARQENINKALRRSLIDEGKTLEELIKESDMIVLAIPVDAVTALLPIVMDQVKEHQVVIDVGSTKAAIMDAVAKHPMRKRFVATHPMAGTEYSGPEAAVANLFDNKVVVLCNVEESDADAVKQVESMYDSIPMRRVYLDGAEHDVHTAYVSHISHITSFALALTVLDKEKNEGRIFDLASGGFASTVRLAKSSPDMWTPIFRQNRYNVVDVLDEHIEVLTRFRNELVNQNFDAIYKLMQDANEIKRILK